MALQHITRYARPSHFVDWADFDRSEYFVVYGQHRDSDTITRSNFRVILQRLGGESETVLVVRDRHDLVGWIESIYVHESDTARLELADRLVGELEKYPVLDEEDWAALEYDEAGSASCSADRDACAASCDPADGYEAGDVLHAIVWDADGRIVGTLRRVLTAEDLGVIDADGEED